MNIAWPTTLGRMNEPQAPFRVPTPSPGVGMFLGRRGDHRLRICDPSGCHTLTRPRGWTCSWGQARAVLILVCPGVSAARGCRRSSHASVENVPSARSDGWSVHATSVPTPPGPAAGHDARPDWRVVRCDVPDRSGQHGRRPDRRRASPVANSGTPYPLIRPILIWGHHT